jgi:hypothetical protein
MKWGTVSKLRFYNDYSVLWKDKSGWQDADEHPRRAFFALPVMFWVDLSKNVNPWGGALNLPAGPASPKRQMVFPH